MLVAIIVLSLVVLAQAAALGWALLHYAEQKHLTKTWRKRWLDVAKNPELKQRRAHPDKPRSAADDVGLWY